jgi:hypothetical protein
MIDTSIPWLDSTWSTSTMRGLIKESNKGVPANRALKIDRSKPIGVASVLGGLHADYRRAA